ncbi:MAG TPA: hypothetical protein VGN04_03905 [Herbaspirillum sp.]
MQGSAILFSEMTPAPEWEGEFNKWYDEEHIPVRMGAEGFLSGQRYRVAPAPDKAPGYLAVYEMTGPDALSTPAYQKIKQQPSETTAWMLKNVAGFTRYTCEEIACFTKDGTMGVDSPILYAVWFNVPQDRLAAFDEWYNEDHAPLLMACKDWQMVRRFNIISGEPGPFNRLALHYLSDMSAMDSPERKKARETPWRAKISAESWFSGTYTIFEKHGARQTKTY